MDNKTINEKIVEIRNFENEIKQMQEVVDSLKDKLFENAEIIYENPSGGILKYNNKEE